VNAALVTAYGNVDVLEVRNVPEPRPGKGELKIRVAPASINQFDIKVRSGRVKAWFPVQFPLVLGFDGSGEVVEVGPDTSTYEVGDLVLGMISHSHAQFAVAAGAALGAVPQALSLVDAASLPVVGLTGVQLIEDGVAPKGYRAHHRRAWQRWTRRGVRSSSARSHGDRRSPRQAGLGCEEARGSGRCGNG
jgi:NADPH:quinone reductase-like Zn-dependent oxidoreductase